MKINNTKIIILAIALASTNAWGQIKEETLLIQRKKPSVLKKINNKKTTIPTLKNYPPEEKNTEKIEYNITNIPILSDFKTSYIQGEDFSPNKQNTYYKNYARIGVGNYGKILGDAGVTTKITDKTDLNASLHINTTTGAKNIYPWKSNATNLNIKTGVDHYVESGKINANLGYGLDSYNYYGIYAIAPQNIHIPQITQNINNISLQAVYDHYNNNILNDIRIKASHLAGNFQTAETQANIKTNLSKHTINTNINDIKINLDAAVGLQIIANSFQENKKLENKYLQAEIDPKITFHKGKTSVAIGTNFTALNRELTENANKTQTNKNYWFPKAEVNIAADQAIQFILGIKGGLQHNTYSRIIQQNPFMLPSQITKSTEEKYNIYFGITGDIDQKITYNFSFGTAKVNDILHYQANDIIDKNVHANRKGIDYANTFSTKYSNGNINQFAIDIAYIPIQNLTIQGDIKIFDYKLDNNEKILNKPNFTANIGAKYHALDKKLTLGAKGYIVGNRDTNLYIASHDNSTYTTTQAYRKLPAHLDLNLSAEYLVHKNFSVFLLGDNLLNKNYEIYQGYKVIGAQITGGIKVRF